MYLIKNGKTISVSLDTARKYFGEKDLRWKNLLKLSDARGEWVSVLNNDYKKLQELYLSWVKTKVEDINKITFNENVKLAYDFYRILPTEQGGEKLKTHLRSNGVADNVLVKRGLLIEAAIIYDKEFKHKSRILSLDYMNFWSDAIAFEYPDNYPFEKVSDTKLLDFTINDKSIKRLHDKYGTPKMFKKYKTLKDRLETYYGKKAEDVLSEDGETLEGDDDMLNAARDFIDSGTMTTSYYGEASAPQAQEYEVTDEAIEYTSVDVAEEMTQILQQEIRNAVAREELGDWQVVRGRRSEIQEEEAQEDSAPQDDEEPGYTSWPVGGG